MLLAELVESGWTAHADRPGEVAEQLARSLHLVGAPSDGAPFARLAAHVYGEHLGRWADGANLLGALRDRPPLAADDEVRALLDRHIAALRHAAGDRDALATLAAEDRISALALAAAALAGRGEIARAGVDLADAMGRAETMRLPEKSPALRALAVAGNNIAATLEEKADRSASETQTMLAAADCGLRYWRLAGSWLEEERALRRLASSRLQAGAAAAALQSALQAAAVCAANAAPPAERFQVAAVTAFAQRAVGDRDAFARCRAAALTLAAELSAEERAACEAQVRELRT